MNIDSLSRTCSPIPECTVSKASGGFVVLLEVLSSRLTAIGRLPGRVDYHLDGRVLIVAGGVLQRASQRRWKYLFSSA